MAVDFPAFVKILVIGYTTLVFAAGFGAGALLVWLL